VPDDNIVDLQEKIRMVLYLNESWQLKDGKAFLGASEKITDSNGETILNAGDLFSEETAGLDPEDSKVVKIGAQLDKESPNNKYYNVEFKVWNKVADQSVSGNYKFHIRQGSAPSN
ncbi:MAG TPA: hypothetical protein VKH37_04425, partial [Ferruginibacter sp.]|nr:hypothetical protein [Ferruginibacter sp.]